MSNALTTTQQANLVPLAEIERAASYIAKSGLFGVKSQEQACALMLVAQSEGLHYARAAAAYDVIQGRPALKSSEVLSRFQNAGGTVKYKQSTATTCIVELSHPQGGILEIAWTIDRAKKAGLIAKDNWQKYPEQMLRARAVSEGVRALFPACLNGFYAAEEVQDFDAPKQPEPPKAQVNAQPQKPQQKAVEAEVLAEQEAFRKEEADVNGAPMNPDYTIDIDGAGKAAPKATPAGVAARPTAGKLTQNGKATLYQFLSQPKVYKVAESIITRYCEPKKVYDLDKTDLWDILCEVTATVKDAWIPAELNNEFMEVAV